MQWEKFLPQPQVQPTPQCVLIADSMHCRPMHALHQTRVYTTQNFGATVEPIMLMTTCIERLPVFKDYFVMSKGQLSIHFDLYYYADTGCLIQVPLYYACMHAAL